jgi:predicted Fe-Mo cluster-binding NifX family protein
VGYASGKATRNSEALCLSTAHRKYSARKGTIHSSRLYPHFQPQGAFMNIAITTTASTLDSKIFCEFAKTPYLLIVNVDTMACTPILHICAAGSDRGLARMVLEHRCEAVITGKLSEEAFELLADDGVTRYVAADMSALAALEAMERLELELIRNSDGSTTCAGSHHKHL